VEFVKKTRKRGGLRISSAFIAKNTGLITKRIGLGEKRGKKRETASPIPKNFQKNLRLTSEIANGMPQRKKQMPIRKNMVTLGEIKEFCRKIVMEFSPRQIFLFGFSAT